MSVSLTSNTSNTFNDDWMRLKALTGVGAQVAVGVADHRAAGISAGIAYVKALAGF